ncbi:methionine/alanine import family NSS transporter small subunit [Shouchella tritolerans]|nr:methionine/alanine import family NSS transporter small subunit [Shouchella tritolerans]
MSGSAIVMMIIGMVILWGGMATSITYAYIVSKRRKKTN